MTIGASKKSRHDIRACQAFADQDRPNVTASCLQHTACPTVFASSGAFCARLTSSGRSVDRAYRRLPGPVVALWRVPQGPPRVDREARHRGPVERQTEAVTWEMSPSLAPGRHTSERILNQANATVRTVDFSPRPENPSQWPGLRAGLFPRRAGRLTSGAGESFAERGASQQGSPRPLTRDGCPKLLSRRMVRRLLLCASCAAGCNDPGNSGEPEYGVEAVQRAFIVGNKHTGARGTLAALAVAIFDRVANASTLDSFARPRTLRTQMCVAAHPVRIPLSPPKFPEWRQCHRTAA